MNDTIITVENLSKRYQLGTIGATTLRDSIERGWHRMLGRNWRQHMGEVGVAKQSVVSSSLVPSQETKGEKAEIEKQDPADQGQRTTNQEHAIPNELWALNDVSFEVKRGEVRGVIWCNCWGCMIDDFIVPCRGSN